MGPLDGFAHGVMETGLSVGVGRWLPSSATARADDRRDPGDDDEEQDRSDRNRAIICQDPLMHGSQRANYRETDQ